MQIKIRRVVVDDAKSIVDYCNQVASESDNLSFGLDEFGISYDQEIEFLKGNQNNPTNFMMIATLDNQIIGLANVSGSSRPRIKHNVELGMSIKKEYWNKGIGSKLLQSIINECKQTNIIRNIHLLVVADNTSAINLYKKYKFKQVGIYSNYHNINNNYKDVLIMERWF